MRKELLACALALSTFSTGAWADCKKRAVQPPTERYELNGDLALDKRTQLTWQRCSVGQQWDPAGRCVGNVQDFTWEEATKLAADGWRIPTREELHSILSSTCRSPSVNEVVFPGIDPGLSTYWTSTKDKSGIWLMDFTDAGERGYTGTMMTNAVRLVKGGRSAAKP